MRRTCPATGARRGLSAGSGGQSFSVPGAGASHLAEVAMRLLLVHPSALMYSKIFLRLEPLGLERVAAAAREAGHQVRVVDLQVCSARELTAELTGFQPEAVGISLNYLANIPEAMEISAEVKRSVPGCFVFFGGHSVSFIADDVLAQAEGSVDAVIRGEGETAIVPLLA